MYHISVVRNLCSFSASNALVFAFSQFACVCMFVCVLYRTAVCISNTCGYKNLRASIFFCFAVCNYKFSNLGRDNFEGSGSLSLRVAITLQSAEKIETEPCFQWNFAKCSRIFGLVACAIRVGGALKMTKWLLMISREEQSSAFSITSAQIHWEVLCKTRLKHNSSCCPAMQSGHIQW